MTTEAIVVKKYVADEGKVFDYAEPHFTEVDGEEVREHLNARVIYLAPNDSISNYIEVAANEDTE